MTLQIEIEEISKPSKAEGLKDPIIQRVAQAYREAPDGICPGCGAPSSPGSKFCSELCCQQWFNDIVMGGF